MGKLSCGRCGFPVERSTALKSAHTKQYYCSEFDECGRRASNDLTLEEINILALRTIGCLK